MKITFLIGNGFDIGIGLHTKYQDFYEKYSSPESDDSKNISDFKTHLKEYAESSDEKKPIIDWADFESAFGKHSNDFESNEKRRYLDRFEHFAMKFNSYLEEEIKNVDYSNAKFISKTMRSALASFYEIRQADKNALQSLIQRLPSGFSYNFISFNYTDCLDQCIKIFKSLTDEGTRKQIRNIIHVHGYIDKNMIMGVNDTSQISNPEFAKDIDVINEIVKPQQNLDGRTAYDNAATDTINESDIICIYGMSIGKTDKKWWNLIAAWLSKSGDHALIILKHDTNYNQRFVFTQSTLANKTVDQFLSFSSLNQEGKNTIRRRIYFCGNHDIFEMNLRKKDTASIDSFVPTSDSNSVEQTKLA